MTKIKSKYGVIEDNKIMLSDNKPTKSSYLKDVKIKCNKSNYVVDATLVNDVNFWFDKPVDSVNDIDHLDVSNKKIKKRRSIFSFFRKKNHIVAGSYKIKKYMTIATSEMTIIKL